MTSTEDLVAWCDENLPELYDVGLYDCEDIAEEVWASVDSVLEESILTFIEDEEERESIADQIHELAAQWFRNHHDMTIEALEPDETAAIILQTKPQIEQHTAEWYAQRAHRLTASEFAQILDGRRGALLRSKLHPDPNAVAFAAAPVAIAQEDGEMSATLWGHRFEPIVRRLYELELAGVDTVCDTLGRVTHHTIPWLSASPDGVVKSGPLAGRLVEIKAPKSRKPGTYVPMDYYVQMQIQMEVCDLAAVDFIEAQFQQRPVYRRDLMAMEADVEEETRHTLTKEDQRAVRDAPWKGIVCVYGHPEDSDSWIYVYSEPVEDWEDVITKARPAGLPLLEKTVWWLTGWFPRTVLRNESWWAATGWPEAQEFWAEVESSREEAGDATTIQHVSGWIGSS